MLRFNRLIDRLIDDNRQIMIRSLIDRSVVDMSINKREIKNLLYEQNDWSFQLQYVA